MFEHSLIDLEPKKQSRRRWISLPVAVALHLVGLTTFAFASYWNVGEVPDQIASNDVYFVTLPLPDLGGGGGGQQKQPEKPAERPQEEAVVPQQQTVQPNLENTPEDVQAPATTTTTVLDDLVATSGSETNSSGGLFPGNGDPNLPNGPGDGPGEIKGPGADGDGGDGLPVRFKVGGMTRPEILHQVQPRYSEKARQVGIQGAVIVEAIIDEQGNVTNVRVLKGLPLGLEQAAVEAIQQWRFKPATQESTGKAVKVYYTLTVNFTIQR